MFSEFKKLQAKEPEQEHLDESSTPDEEQPVSAEWSELLRYCKQPSNRPTLKVKHDWGNQQVTICGNGTVRTIPVNPRTGPRPKLPEVLVCYDFAKGLTEQQELNLLLTEEELIPIGTIELSARIQVDLMERHARPYPQQFYEHKEGAVSIDEAPAYQKIPGGSVETWTKSEQKAVREINIGTDVDPKSLKINSNQEADLANAAEHMLWKYSDVFAWSYKDLKRIPAKLAEHKIELDPDIRTIHQARYLCWHLEFWKCPSGHLEYLGAIRSIGDAFYNFKACQFSIGLALSDLDA